MGLSVMAEIGNTIKNIRKKIANLFKKDQVFPWISNKEPRVLTAVAVKTLVILVRTAFPRLEKMTWLCWVEKDDYVYRLVVLASYDPSFECGPNTGLPQYRWAAWFQSTKEEAIIEDYSPEEITKTLWTYAVANLQRKWIAEKKEES